MPVEEVGHGGKEVQKTRRLYGGQFPRQRFAKVLPPTLDEGLDLLFA